MIYLLEFNTNVDELFECSSSTTQPSSTNQSSINNNHTTNDSQQISTLKLFYRQFFSGENKKSNFCYLEKLNTFIQNPNVYRKIYFDLIKSCLNQMKQNLILMNLITNDLQMNSTFESMSDCFFQYFNYYPFNNLHLEQFIFNVRDFLNAIDSFIIQKQIQFNVNTNSQITFRDLLSFSELLMQRFFKPRTLKELSRFHLRKMLFYKLDSSNRKYNMSCMKMDQMKSMLDSLQIPNYLKTYILHQA
jgi:hypothetical protein